MKPNDDMNALAKGGRTNIFGFFLRLLARLPFLFIAGRLYGAETVGRFALAVVVVELAALLATLGLKRGLAQALASTDRPHAHVVWDGMVVAFVVSMLASAVLFIYPDLMFPNSGTTGLDRYLAVIVFAIAWSDVSLAARAYRHNVKATVTGREPAQARDLPEAVISRSSRSSPSSAEMPACSSSVRRRGSEGSSKMPETRARCSPVRIMSGEARPPNRRLRAPTTRLLPLPVSPVSTLKPG